MNDHRSEPAETTASTASTESIGTIASIECETCVAANTTACADCVVAHLLANDDGPIEFATVAVATPTTPAERERQRVVALFSAAGMLADPVEFVEFDEFEAAGERSTASALR